MFLAAFATSVRAELPSGIIEIVRQLDEWHGKSAFWVRETVRVYPTNQAPLVKIKESYIEASSVANSLIDQLKLQTASRSKISLKQYTPHFARAKTATEALAEEGKRLLLQTSEGKTRGAAKQAGTQPGGGTNDYAQFIADNAQKTISAAGALVDVFDRHKKAFSDLQKSEVEEVTKVLDQSRWESLETHISAALKADSPQKEK